MRPIQFYDEYLKRKADCEDVISWAEFFWRWLFQGNERHPSVLTILPSESFVDYYHYGFSRLGKPYLKGWKYGCPNKLLASLELGVYADPAVQQWWDQVFFQDDNGVSYDKYYDDFRISESSALTFSHLLDRIRSEIGKIPIPKDTHIFLPHNIVNHKPLLYVLQSEFGASISVIPEISVDSHFNESFPRIKNNKPLILNAGGGIPLDDLLGHCLTIQVPNLSATLESHALPGITWGMIASGNNYRYFLGDIEFFEIMIMAEIDLFGNVFLNVYEFNKKIKCIKVSLS